jgi:HEPN domain-containing protein
MHLSSARILAATQDVAAAFVTACDAARKSLSAMLAVQGLRARGGDGGHRVLSELMQAQLPRHRRTLREFDWMRQKRNDTQYPDPGKPTATANDVTDGIAAAQRIVELGEQFLELVTAQRKTGRGLESGGRCLPVPASLSSVPCPHQVLLWLNAGYLRPSRPLRRAQRRDPYVGSELGTLK